MSPRKVHVKQIWGTVVSIDTRFHRCAEDNYEVAIAEIDSWLKDVDSVFSTFKSHSAVNMYRRGELEIENFDSGMRDVFNRCQQIKDLTKGLFDPWAVPEGYDPSGLVKGWAADRAANIFVEYGFKDFMINAGGDIITRGQPESDKKWAIGLQHPELPGEIYTSVQTSDNAVATSGIYERGEHIVNPLHQGIKAVSATVIGPDGATADALATALLIAGSDGFTWFDQLPGWSAQVIENQIVTSIGPTFISGDE